MRPLMRVALPLGLALALLVAILLLKRILKLLLTGKHSVATSQETLVNQPDSIRLRRRTFDWQNQAAMHNLMGPLLARSFLEVGDFSIAEKPQLKLRFLVEANELHLRLHL